MGAGVYGPSRLVRVHQRSRPSAPGQLFKARLREESGTPTRGAPRAPGKGPIAQRARGLRRQAQGDPWHTKRKKARSVASGLPRAAGWLRSARGPAYLCALRHGHGKFANSRLCGQRLAAPEVTALQALPPGRHPPSPQPRPTAKCSSKGQVRRRRPAPLPRAHPAPGCRVGGSPGPFAPTCPADSLLQFLPPWSPRSVSALYRLPSLLPFFPILPDPNGRGRSSGGRREVRGALPCAPGCVRSHPHSWSHRSSYPAQRTRPPSHLWGLPFVLEAQVRTCTRGHTVPPGRPPEIPEGCGGVAGSGRVLNTRPSKHRTGASPAPWPWLSGPGVSRTRRLQEGQEAAVLGRDIAVPPNPPPPHPLRGQWPGPLPGLAQQGMPVPTCHGSPSPAPAPPPTSGSLTLSMQQLRSSCSGTPPLLPPSSPGAMRVCPVATGNCLCRKLSPQSSLMLIDGQKHDIFWSLAGAGAGTLPAAGAL